MRIVIRFVVLAAVLGGIAYYVYLQSIPQPLVLTGIVTTDEIIVSPQITGRVSDLKVNQGDAVKKDDVIAVLAPEELRQEPLEPLVADLPCWLRLPPVPCLLLARWPS